MGSMFGVRFPQLSDYPVWISSFSSPSPPRELGHGGARAQHLLRRQRPQDFGRRSKLSRSRPGRRSRLLNATEVSDPMLGDLPEQLQRCLWDPVCGARCLRDPVCYFCASNPGRCFWRNGQLEVTRSNDHAAGAAARRGVPVLCGSGPLSLEERTVRLAADDGSSGSHCPFSVAKVAVLGVPVALAALLCVACCSDYVWHDQCGKGGGRGPRVACRLASCRMAAARTLLAATLALVGLGYDCWLWTEVASGPTTEDVGRSLVSAPSPLLGLIGVTHIVVGVFFAAPCALMAFFV